MKFEQCKKTYDQFNKKDITTKFNTFNTIYSIDELKKLSPNDLVIRLFRRAGVEPRGLFGWLERGNEPTKTTVRSESGGQIGILYKDNNDIVLYHYATNNNEEQANKQVIDISETEKYAQDVLKALEESCNIIKDKSFNKKEDYEETYDEICKKLKTIDRPVNAWWYWNEDGEPGIFFLKYSFLKVKFRKNLLL